MSRIILTLDGPATVQALLQDELPGGGYVTVDIRERWQESPGPAAAVLAAAAETYRGLVGADRITATPDGPAAVVVEPAWDPPVAEPPAVEP